MDMKHRNLQTAQHLGGQAIHELPQPLVEVVGVERVEQLVARPLVCRGADGSTQLERVRNLCTAPLWMHFASTDAIEFAACEAATTSNTSMV